MVYKESMQKRTSLCNAKRILRNLYSDFLCPQTCLLCGKKSNTGAQLCENCIATEFNPYIDSASVKGLQTSGSRCRRCGKILISESDYCTHCISSEQHGSDKRIVSCDRVFTLFPYIGLGQRLLPIWKNNNLRAFSAVFAPLIYRFLMQTPVLLHLPVVPVPPRPKKLREKGWDQVEDLAQELTAYPQLTICRCLKRQDGVPQKRLSKTDRAMNLQGKISVSTKTVPDTLILLDDVMTTGATLETCAHALKTAGCKEVYGLCLFFD